MHANNTPTGHGYVLCATTHTSETPQQNLNAAAVLPITVAQHLISRVEPRVHRSNCDVDMKDSSSKIAAVGGAA
jgi:hypothetical protein